MKVRATLIELWKKVTPFKTQENVFWNGENNAYSEEMELAWATLQLVQGLRKCFQSLFMVKEY